MPTTNQAVTSAGGPGRPKVDPSQWAQLRAEKIQKAEVLRHKNRMRLIASGQLGNKDGPLPPKNQQVISDQHQHTAQRTWNGSVLSDLINATTSNTVQSYSSFNNDKNSHDSQYGDVNQMQNGNSEPEMLGTSKQSVNDIRNIKPYDSSDYLNSDLDSNALSNQNVWTDPPPPRRFNESGRFSANFVAEQFGLESIVSSNTASEEGRHEKVQANSSLQEFEVGNKFNIMPLDNGSRNLKYAQSQTSTQNELDFNAAKIHKNQLQTLDQNSTSRQIDVSESKSDSLPSHSQSIQPGTVNYLRNEYERVAARTNINDNLKTIQQQFNRQENHTVQLHGNSNLEDSSNTKNDTSNCSTQQQEAQLQQFNSQSNGQSREDPESETQQQIQDQWMQMLRGGSTSDFVRDEQTDPLIFGKSKKLEQTGGSSGSRSKKTQSHGTSTGQTGDAVQNNQKDHQTNGTKTGSQSSQPMQQTEYKGGGGPGKQNDHQYLHTDSTAVSGLMPDHIKQRLTSLNNNKSSNLSLNQNLGNSKMSFPNSKTQQSYNITATTGGNGGKGVNNNHGAGPGSGSTVINTGSIGGANHRMGFHQLHFEGSHLGGTPSKDTNIQIFNDQQCVNDMKLAEGKHRQTNNSNENRTSISDIHGTFDQNQNSGVGSGPGLGFGHESQSASSSASTTSTRSGRIRGSGGDRGSVNGSRNNDINDDNQHYHTTSNNNDSISNSSNQQYHNTLANALPGATNFGHFSNGRNENNVMNVRGGDTMQGNIMNQNQLRSNSINIQNNTSSTPKDQVLGRTGNTTSSDVTFKNNTVSALSQMPKDRHDTKVQQESEFQSQSVLNNLQLQTQNQLQQQHSNQRGSGSGTAGSGPGPTRNSNLNHSNVNSMNSRKNGLNGGGTAQRALPQPFEDDEDKCYRQMFDKNTLRLDKGGKLFQMVIRRIREVPHSLPELFPRLHNYQIQNGSGTTTQNQLQSTSLSDSGVRVFARKRPMFERDLKNQDFDCITIPKFLVGGLNQDLGNLNNNIIIHNCLYHADLKKPFISHNSFQLDHVFDESATNEEVYSKAASNLVDHAIGGGVSTIFMLGQTGSGKTFTMTAIESMAANHIFNQNSNNQNSQNQNSNVKASIQFLEVRNNRVFDLLHESGPNKEVKLREISSGRYSVLDAYELECSAASELRACMQIAHVRRSTESTHVNDTSSRSHALCFIRLSNSVHSGVNDSNNNSNQTNLRGSSNSMSLPMPTSGKLVLVDCAGTERRKDTRYHNKERQIEGAQINSSLHALKECIRYKSENCSNSNSSNQNSISNNNDSGVPSHIYRSSCLTKLLADAFSNKGQLCVFCTVSPCASDTEHSITTLRTGFSLTGRASSSSAQSSSDHALDHHQHQNQNLSFCYKQTDIDKFVNAVPVKRTTPVHRWSEKQVRAWIEGVCGSENSNLLPAGTTGHMLVRMTENRFNMLLNCPRKGRRLYEALHEEMALNK